MFSATKKLGAIEIDENKRIFRIDGNIQKKTGLIGGAAKATLAVTTLGASAVISAASHARNKTPWIPFDQFIDFTVNNNNIRVRRGFGFGTRVAGLGVGTGGSTISNQTQSCSVVVYFDSLDFPSIEIPITDRPLKGAKFKQAQQYLRDTVSALEYIKRHK